jgi:hypothetical protein
VLRVVTCAATLVVLLTPTAADSVAQTTVTITFRGGGKALWKLDGDRETSRVALSYRWHGAVRFVAPLSLLADPKHRRLSVSGATALVGSWTGRYTSNKAGTITTCTYRGTRVKARVTAKLAKGRAGNTVELTLHPRTPGGFFSDKGRGAVVRCSTGYSQSAPSHFVPSWFFRDNLQDRGRLSSETAIIVLPGTLLPRGSATVAFPNEHGRNASEGLAHLAWSNRGQVVVNAG